MASKINYSAIAWPRVCVKKNKKMILLFSTSRLPNHRKIFLRNQKATCNMQDIWTAIFRPFFTCKPDLFFTQDSNKLFLSDRNLEAAFKKMQNHWLLTFYWTMISLLPWIMLQFPSKNETLKTIWFCMIANLLIASPSYFTRKYWILQ